MDLIGCFFSCKNYFRLCSVWKMECRWMHSCVNDVMIVARNPSLWLRCCVLQSHVIFFVSVISSQTNLLLPSSNKTDDDIVLELVNDALTYLPQQVDSNSDAMTSDVLADSRRFLAPDSLKQMRNKSQDNSGDRPDQTVYVNVLRQEINRFDRLLKVIHSSLSSLRLAVKGEVLMSEQLDEIYNALLSNRVPKAWEVTVSSPMKNT